MLKRIIAVSLIVSLGVAGVALAQTGYEILIYNVNGGGTSTSQEYTMTGAAGQRGVGVATGGDYRLSGGFIMTRSSETSDNTIYLPSIER